MMDQIRSIVDEKVKLGQDDSFYLLSLKDVREKWHKWIQKIPRVIPFYAIKCNDNEHVVKILADLGAGFDCASKKEIAQVLSLNVSEDRIVYTHTAKQLTHLKFARDHNIKKLTFDSVEELQKIKDHYPTAEVVLRIRFDAESSIINLGTKFGVDPNTEAPELIKACMELEMNLIGICFHVGSGAIDRGIFEKALDKVRELFDYAKMYKFDLNFVDIGGGFIGKDLNLHAESINRAIEKNFPDPKVTIISEPGRYFVDTAFKIVTQIILKKQKSDSEIHYFVNESIYTSFMMNFLYGGKIKFDIIRRTEKSQALEKLSTIWGCACNSNDKILSDEMISEMEIGDWLVIHDMGAYSRTIATSFNGFSVGDIIITNQ